MYGKGSTTIWGKKDPTIIESLSSSAWRRKVLYLKLPKCSQESSSQNCNTQGHG